MAIWLFSVIISLKIGNFEFIQTIQSWKINYYDVYLNRVEGVGTDPGFNWGLNIILLLILIINNQDWNKDTKNLVIFNLFYFGVLLLNFRIVSDWFFRVSIYFTISYIVLLPNSVTLIPKPTVRKNEKFKIIGHLIIYVIIVYYSFLLFSYSFRPNVLGNTLGTKMYPIIEMFK